MSSTEDIQKPEVPKMEKFERNLALYTSKEWGQLARSLSGTMRPLPGFEGRYSISDHGYIFNGHGVRLRPSRRITRTGVKQGPVMVCLWDGSRSVKLQLARIVFGVFCCEGGRMQEYEGLVHLDDDIENCALSNLRLLDTKDTVIS